MVARLDRLGRNDQLARLDRACDVTDLVDNVLGAGIGCVIGVVLLPVLRPWRDRAPN